VLLALATGLLFCHGCHDHDVDDELCVPVLDGPARSGSR
jgi:hypothetical protein